MNIRLNKVFFNIFFKYRIHLKTKIMRIELSLKDLIMLISEFKDEIITEEEIKYFLTYWEGEHTIEVVGFNN